MQICFYATLRPLVGRKSVEIPLAEGSTVREMVEAVVRSYPQLRRVLVDENGRPARHIHIFVNGRDTHHLRNGLETPLKVEDRIDVFPAVAGGGVTTVTLRFTGEVRARMGTDKMTFTFDGNILGELLTALFASHALRDLILDDIGELRPYSRVAVNGRFSHTLVGLDTPIQEGDTITLIRPYVVAF